MKEKVFIESEVFTVGEAARFLGLKYQTIWNYIGDGRLTRERFKTLTLVYRADCLAYQNKYHAKRLTHTEHEDPTPIP